MSFDNISISVEGLSKKFELYTKPSDQLKQILLPKIQRLLGKKERQYFHEFHALNNVTFNVNKGEAFGIIGRNGSGKSTLLQIITGTLAPTSGTVSINGRVGALLELGSGFNPEFSGRENIYLNGNLLGLTRQQIDEKFDYIASFADIGLHLDQPVKTYSSGMTVRLAMAVQTQIEPDVLIVDEALAVGDALFQKKCYRQIDKLLNNGCTLIFVSHDQEVVRSLTSRALFLNNGQVVKYGQTAEALFAYREFLQKQEEAAFSHLQINSNLALKAQNLDKSYGTKEVEILNVKILASDGSEQTIFYVGDMISIVIECICHVEMDHLNVAFRILSKEGVKVTTWGTLNEDISKYETNIEDTFWIKRFSPDDRFTVTFEGTCHLGANFYEIQTVVAREHDRYYANQQVLHWLDEAQHFNVILKPKEYVFDGVFDMGLRSTFNLFPRDVSFNQQS